MDLELVSEHILQMIVDFKVCAIIDPEQIQHDLPGGPLLDPHYVCDKADKDEMHCISPVQMILLFIGLFGNVWKESMSSSSVHPFWTLIFSC